LDFLFVWETADRPVRRAPRKIAPRGSPLSCERVSNIRALGEDLRTLFFGFPPDRFFTARLLPSTVPQFPTTRTLKN
jgi:hypothetical protein